MSRRIAARRKTIAVMPPNATNEWICGSLASLFSNPSALGKAASRYGIRYSAFSTGYANALSD
jgi:hypothetical protein